jgi:hypothetical protein
MLYPYIDISDTNNIYYYFINLYKWLMDKICCIYNYDKIYKFV